MKTLRQGIATRYELKRIFTCNNERIETDSGMHDMSKLQQLTTFLRENLPAESIGKTEFTSDMGKIRFIQAQRDLGLGQYQMFIQKYEAVISWENFPYREQDPRYIPLLIDAWLTEQNDELGSANQGQERPTMTVKANKETAVVVVSLSLSEPVIMREDKNGIVPFDGKRWLLAPPEIWFAENSIVHYMDESGTAVEQIQ
ncbi:phage tail protein [Xenorhabdus sp. XENO-10]|uniref:Phage tail protein n=1 Tax=Xenorhabdus yunnanensis TaxID=3025878 RepID=A0ABT5LDJ7_9GAMM|nr:phage tail protein [Xenorhabdus yunnanensis]MDC9589182.1 phage tail protein [Xenorhabdus yunnanensis]